MNYWLVKSDADTYSWGDFVKLGRDHWDGVRNYQARNNMKEMKVGDLVLFYHSVQDKQVVGIAKVVKEYYPDPTTDDDRWVVVDLAPESKLKKPVALADIKANKKLQNVMLVRQGRLSVMPLTRQEYHEIIRMSES